MFNIIRKKFCFINNLNLKINEQYFNNNYSDSCSYRYSIFSFTEIVKLYAAHQNRIQENLIRI